MVRPPRSHPPTRFRRQRSEDHRGDRHVEPAPRRAARHCRPSSHLRVTRWVRDAHARRTRGLPLDGALALIPARADDREELRAPGRESRSDATRLSDHTRTVNRARWTPLARARHRAVPQPRRVDTVCGPRSAPFGADLARSGWGLLGKAAKRCRSCAVGAARRPHRAALSTPGPLPGHHGAKSPRSSPES